jgi:hypothetical protein
VLAAVFAKWSSFENASRNIGSQLYPERMNVGMPAWLSETPLRARITSVVTGGTSSQAGLRGREQPRVTQIRCEDSGRLRPSHPGGGLESRPEPSRTSPSPRPLRVPATPRSPLRWRPPCRRRRSAAHRWRLSRIARNCRRLVSSAWPGAARRIATRARHAARRASDGHDRRGVPVPPRCAVSSRSAWHPPPVE